MTPTVSAVLAIAMLAVFALIAGAAYLIVRRGDRKRGVLMLIAALVLAANVAILTWPV